MGTSPSEGDMGLTEPGLGDIRAPMQQLQCTMTQPHVRTHGDTSKQAQSQCAVTCAPPLRLEMGETATRLNGAAATARQEQSSIELRSEHNGRSDRIADETSDGGSFTLEARYHESSISAELLI